MESVERLSLFVVYGVICEKNNRPAAVMLRNLGVRRRLYKYTELKVAFVLIAI